MSRPVTKKVGHVPKWTLRAGVNRERGRSSGGSRCQLPLDGGEAYSLGAGPPSTWMDPVDVIKKGG